MMEMKVSEMVREQEKVIEEFSHFTDWSDKYEYLIDAGKALSPLDVAFKTDAHLVKGCQSRVWLHAEVKAGRLYLSADSDTVITKGIIALLIRVLSGHLLKEIENADLFFIDAIGLQSHLSATRSNGLKSMIQYIKSYAKHMPDEQVLQTANQTPYRELMISKIKEIFDPEIPVDIWELGLIYELEKDDQGKVNVSMTLTSPACPVAESLPMEVQEKLLSLPFVTDVELSLVWNPPWNKSLMSDEARMALDMF